MKKEAENNEKRGYFYIKGDAHLKLKAYCALSRQKYTDVMTSIVEKFLESKEVKSLLEKFK